MLKGLERMMSEKEQQNEYLDDDEEMQNLINEQILEPHVDSETEPQTNSQTESQNEPHDEVQDEVENEIQDEAQYQPAEKTEQDSESSGKKKRTKSSQNIIPGFVKKLRKLKPNSKWGELTENTHCQVCGGPADESLVTSCFHLYYKECLCAVQLEAAEKELDHAKCVKCGHQWEETQPCDGLKELEVRNLSSTVFQDDDKDKTKTKPKYRLTMKYVDFDKLVLSTKIAAVKGQLEEWIRQDPNAKIIVFSEWHMVYVLLLLIQFKC